jgi:hypothetical protein
LNLYGFRRIARGEDLGCYFHPNFHRGRKDLLKEIKRLPVKGSLMNYEQVLALHNSRSNSIPTNATTGYYFHPSIPRSFTEQSVISMKTRPIDSCHDSSSGDDLCDSSISSSWTNTGCDSPIPLEFQENFNDDIDFFNIFSTSKIDFNVVCPSCVEPREYIPTYEEALFYGLINH